LVVVSDTTTATGGQVVVEDYNKHPAVCRSGVWMGWEKTFTETVILAYEHTEELYVGWSVNGVTVIDPGYGPIVNFPGNPCPGLPSVSYICPVGGLFHQISFTSTSGDPYECLWAQVLYRGNSEKYVPAHLGPSMEVCLAGSDIEWPAYLIQEEEACLARLWDLLKRYVEIAHVNPGDPVEFLGGLPIEELIQLQAAVQTLENINAQEQPALASGLQESIVGILRSRMPGASGVSGMAAAQPEARRFTRRHARDHQKDDR
jgi:hypothetical protein